MYTDAVDAIRYIENNLKIKLDKEFDIVTESYVITAELILDNKVISEDKIEFEAI